MAIKFYDKDIDYIRGKSYNLMLHYIITFNTTANNYCRIVGKKSNHSDYWSFHKLSLRLCDVFNFIFCYLEINL